MAKQKNTSATKQEVSETTSDLKKVGYEEWRCEIKGKEVEKVKRLRANVKITDEEAETLNHGAKDSPRQDYVIMYFKPE